MKKFFIPLFIAPALFFSCQTTNVSSSQENVIENQEQYQSTQDEQPTEIQEQKKEMEPMEEPITESKITMVFAGDIMAHSNNYKPGRFDRIWKYVSPLIKSADLAFGNIEAPVHDGLDWSNYPRFNMHTSYVEAVIDAGFNVFSLANNHTNDQFLNGIRATKKYFDNREGIWSSGLKDATTDPINFQLIEKEASDGSKWNVLFVAMTEVLNSYDSSSYINFYPSSASKRLEFKESLKKIAQENPHDLFVISIHTDEPEYILKVTESHKTFYRELISQCGADIIWCNHPHVTKEFERLLPGDEESGLADFETRNREAFIMYANGNTISGQRLAPNFNNPTSADENVGDGMIVKVTATRKNVKEGIKPVSYQVEPFFITTYVTPVSPTKQYVIRFLDEAFMEVLDSAGIFTWQNYVSSRKKVMEQVLEKSKY